jgi:hypothetical protein
MRKPERKGNDILDEMKAQAKSVGQHFGPALPLGEGWGEGLSIVDF